MTTTDLTAQLAERAQTPARRGSGTTIADLIKAQKPQIALALPAHIGTERFTRIALTELRRNPKLAACNPMSLLGALMQSAQLGLEPGPLGQAYLVPFKDEVTFIVGYRGLIDLFRRSGEMESIVAREVREHDQFEFWVDETGDRLRHVPTLTGERGQAYAYYAIARFRDGGQLVHVMTRDDVERHRKRSRAKDSGPWVTDYDAMARKTVIRAMAPYLPLSAEIADAIESDERTYEWQGSQGVTPMPDPEPTVEPPAALPAPSQYDAWDKTPLQEECRRRGLPVSGTKADLAARLIEHDTAAGATVEIVEGPQTPSTGEQAGDDGPSLPDPPAEEPEPSLAGDGAGQDEGNALPDDWPASSASSTPSPDTVSDDPAFWSTDRWADEADQRGVNRNTVLRQAREIATDLGVAQDALPAEFGDWTNPAIAELLGAWLTGRGDAA